MLLAEKITAAARMLAALHTGGKYPCTLRYVTAESLTAGMIAAAIAEVPGASAWLERGFIVYNNKAKHEMLGVPWDVLAHSGEVSAPCVSAMAMGALMHSDADLSVAVSGIAGPGGGSSACPVGTVFMGIGVKMQGEAYVRHFNFKGERQEIRQKTTVAALAALVRFSLSVGSTAQAGSTPGPDELQQQLQLLEQD